MKVDGIAPAALSGHGHAYERPMPVAGPNDAERTRVAADDAGITEGSSKCCPRQTHALRRLW
jgi:hypothetical protein